MTDRLRRVALVVIAFCVLTSAAEAHTPSPSFAVRIEGRGPAMILIPGCPSGVGSRVPTT